jgi:hypothetical protein
VDERAAKKLREGYHREVKSRWAALQARVSDYQQRMDSLRPELARLEREKALIKDIALEMTNEVRGRAGGSVTWIGNRLLLGS